MRPRIPSQLPSSPAPRHLFNSKAPSISSGTCESDSSSQSGNPEFVICSALCMFDFTSSEVELLSFRKNELLDIVKCTDGWWAAMKKGDTILGWVPQTYVTPLTQEMAEKLQDIREELRGAELKRVEDLYHSTENTTPLSVVIDGSPPLSPILESKDLLKLYDHVRKGKKHVHPPQSFSHSRISPTSSTRPLARSVSTNSSSSSPKGTDDNRFRFLSVRGPQQHPVIVDDSVTLSRISTLIRSTDFKQMDKATSHPDTPFRSISSAVFKPAQEDKLPRKFTETGGIPFVTISGSDRDVEKHNIQEVIEPGEQVIDISRPPSDGTPWYLLRQYADQLDTDDKGNVRFGSMVSLFEMLTFPPKPTNLAQYRTFTNVFLMTLRTFTTADHLFDMLVERYHFEPNEPLTESEYLNWKANLRTPVQRLVLDILKKWIENYHLLEEEPHITQRLKEFLNLIVSPPLNKIATIIMQTIDRMRSTKQASRVVSSLSTKARKSISKLDLLKLDPKIIADQLTVYEFGLYSKITPQQCLTYMKNRMGDDVAKLRDFCSTHDKLDAWVKLSILNSDAAGKRAQTVDFWIKVAERCRRLNNISSMSAIITALSSTVITGLQLSWARTCRKSVLDGLLRYSDPTGGFAKYRALLQQAEGPCVPFITMFLTEMVRVDQISGSEGRISFYQRTRWYEIITAMLMFQSRPYKIAADEPTLNFIEGHLREGSCCDPGWLWKKSQEIQRAEATHADIRRGLEAAGF